MAAILIILSIILATHATPSQYHFVVYEGIPVDTYIGKVTLPGDKPNCSYNIDGSDDFRLGPNGDIYTTAVLDREVQTEYTLQVSCGNGATPFAHIRVDVLDLNDNAPVFSQSSYSFFIKEDTLPGTEIGQVSATDYDVGVNSLITYTMQTNKELNFMVDSRTGQIVLTTPPKEVLYVLQVKAQDAGQPSWSTMCHVYIISPRSFTFRVPESVPVNYDVGSVLKVPAGIDDVFSGIHVSPPDVPFTLKLNNNTASLYTLSQLDREIRDIYHFHVMATTSGVERLIANVTVNVLDVNDNRPWFSRRMYNITVNANSPAFTTLLTVRATDIDIDSQLVYSIVTKSGTQPFSIDAMTGLFSLVHTLDRRSYSVEIQVSDGLFFSQAWIYITTVFDEEVVG